VSQPKGAPEPKISPEQRAEATVVNINLTSPALEGFEGHRHTQIPAAYTCDGKNTWPGFEWKGIPSGTEELVLFAVNLKPVNGKIFFDWAVAGLDPSLEGIKGGTLPKGAVVGENSFGKTGYSICPAQGAQETYFFALYALPKALSPQQGFDPGELRQEVKEETGSAGLRTDSYTRG
jgi:phosphatidylethanolamine-binding protein (PEBP) family uncharacterized protein